MSETTEHSSASPSEEEKKKEKENKKELISREELWKDAFETNLENGALVQITGLDDKEHHTAFARVANGVETSIGAVVKCVVDEGWKLVVKDILEKKEHIQVDSHPPAAHLLKLGAVWLCNETDYTHAKGAHAHRLAPKDEERTPDWKDFTVRVYYVPDRFFAAYENEWTKYMKGLLIDKTVQVQIGDETPHVPVAEGMPDAKDGVIVYENNELGFAVVNKPGSMPVHATLSNHAEDVISMYRAALEERHRDGDKNHTKEFVAVPQRNTATLDIHTYGLLTISLTQKFEMYYDHLFDNTKQVSKKFKCLVCVKDPDSMSKLEALQKSGTVVTHYVHHKSPTPKRFVRHKPKKENKGDWQECQMKILQVGDEQFRAACVKSRYKTSVDTTLSHLLWGPNPPDGVEYVMEVQLKLVSTARAQQIRGQLAALGFPIVGDFQYGGGKCEFYSHKHAWNRMAIQCCELSFPEPKWKDENSKKKFVASDKMCVFGLHEAWWSSYLQRYEHSHSFS